MEAKRSYKVPLHHPKGFRKQKSVRSFFLYRINNSLPKFTAKTGCKLLITHGMIGSARYVARISDRRIPQASYVSGSKGHCGIKTDNGECFCNMQYYIYYRSSDILIKIIKLCSVIPWHACSVVAMIDIPHFPCSFITAHKCYRAICFIVIVVLNLYFNIIR